MKKLIQKELPSVVKLKKKKKKKRLFMIIKIIKFPDVFKKY